ncbi:UDP-glucose 4-epimerase GalE [Algimonas porphyrae]|uniref:UDP-glucose 4-epimerase GalE n=1 Tax=Algimonas porphyrae TaxID=1128113 RepID=UPI00352A950F
MSILVTGGAGYIGSHTAVALIESGHDVVVIDNYSNSSPDVIARVEALTGATIPAYTADIADRQTVTRILKDHDCDTVMHFAGLKAVGNSVAQPLDYYRENVAGALSLFEAMQAAQVRRCVFSSSATVYGAPQFLPFTEDHPLAPASPYGWSKLMIEQILRDLAISDPDWRIAVLRYFNPCGAHPSGQIGENPIGRPNNLMPFIAQVAVGRRPHLDVMGDDYDTSDGTGVRDYIHVVDLARGHVAALDLIERETGWNAVNLGTGAGYSVMDMLRAFEKAVGHPIAHKIGPRRPGDVAAYWADTQTAEARLGWRAELGVERMCEDHWRWQQSLIASQAEPSHPVGGGL